MPTQRTQLAITLKRPWLALLVVIFVAIPTAGFVLVSAGLLAYTFWPIDVTRVDRLPLTPETTHLVVIAHGVNDTPASWATPLRSTLQSILEQQDSPTSSQTQIIALDWSEHASSSFRCSVNGKRVGAHLGRQLSLHTQLASVHLIGHSCGSFVVYGLCSELKKHRADVLAQSTYLDPVSIYGGLWWRYGLDHFGSCADFSDAYIDHEDGVPGSDVLVPNTHTFDVTEARRQGAHPQSPHVWPTAYYQLLVSAGQQPQLHLQPDLAERYPLAVLEVIQETPK